MVKVNDPEEELVTFSSCFSTILKPLRLLPTLVDQLTGSWVLGAKPAPVTLTVIPTVATFGSTVIRGPDAAFVCETIMAGMTDETWGT